MGRGETKRKLYWMFISSGDLSLIFLTPTLDSPTFYPPPPPPPSSSSSTCSFSVVDSIGDGRRSFYYYFLISVIATVVVAVVVARRRRRRGKGAWLRGHVTGAVPSLVFTEFCVTELVGGVVGLQGSAAGPPAAPDFVLCFFCFKNSKKKSKKKIGNKPTKSEMRETLLFFCHSRAYTSLKVICLTVGHIPHYRSYA